MSPQPPVDVGNVFELKPPRETLIEHLGLVKQLEQLRERRPDLADDFAKLAERWLNAAVWLADGMSSDDADWVSLSLGADGLVRAMELAEAFAGKLADEVNALP